MLLQVVFWSEFNHLKEVCFDFFTVWAQLSSFLEVFYDKVILLDILEKTNFFGIGQIKEIENYPSRVEESQEGLSAVV